MSVADSPDVDALDVGDVIVIDRSVGELEARTFATVVANGARGPRIVGPDYPVATYANALKVDEKTRYKRVLGRDGRGAFHLIRRGRDGFDVVDVVAAPGADPEHTQPVVDRDVIVSWIQHVDDRRGWDTLAEQFVDAIDGGEVA